MPRIKKQKKAQQLRRSSEFKQKREIEIQSPNSSANFFTNLGVLQSAVVDQMGCLKCHSKMTLKFTRLKLFSMDFRLVCSNNNCDKYSNPPGYHATTENFDEVRDYNFCLI